MNEKKINVKNMIEEKKVNNDIEQIVQKDISLQMGLRLFIKICMKQQKYEQILELLNKYQFSFHNDQKEFFYFMKIYHKLYKVDNGNFRILVDNYWKVINYTFKNELMHFQTIQNLIDLLFSSVDSKQINMNDIFGDEEIESDFSHGIQKYGNKEIICQLVQ